MHGPPLFPRRIDVRALALTLPFLIAACSGQADDPAGNTTPDTSTSLYQPIVNDSDLGAPAPPPEPMPDVSKPDAALPGIDAPPNAPQARPVATPSPEPGREEAARIVRSYYAKIGRGDYAAARAMWDDDGDASGLTQEEYAKRFDRFSAFRAEVGTPGRIDAGAGQRYVEVPVRVMGKLKADGRVIERTGTVTLHRTGDIEGATPAQRRWRIAGAETIPVPTPTPTPAPEPGPTPSDTATPTATPTVTARYRCENGARIVATFDNDAGTVALRRGYQRLGTLQQQRSGSGIWYKGEKMELRGKGDAATITLPGQPPVECSAD
jgi:membrane-bound inhibitor of C-type lysozyme